MKAHSLLAFWPRIEIVERKRVAINLREDGQRRLIEDGDILGISDIIPNEAVDGAQNLIKMDFVAVRVIAVPSEDIIITEI